MTQQQQESYNTALQRIEACRRERATQLDLDDLGLARLPPEIGQLTALTYLSLNDNRLSTLPPEIGQLTALTHLSLNGNQLSTLPPEIGQLTALATLNLSQNQLSPLPPVISQLTALTRLCLDDNQLSTLPPEIGQLTVLTRLDLQNNQLSSLPPEFGHLAALTILDLDGNRLSTLPPEIGQLSALELLFLSGNQLISMTPVIGQLTVLTHLSLNSNQLSTLPPVIGQLTALTHLSLDRNQLNTLPPVIGQLTALTHLSLDRNQLSTLPQEIGQLTALMHLSLNSNQLSTLPQEIGQLTVLTNLYLYSNQLSTLPPEIGQLTSLTILDLNSNQLSSLPQEIGQLAALTELYLHRNQALAIPDSILGPENYDVVLGRDITAARPQDILNFYFAQRQAVATSSLRAVNELKVMLVGRGGAGKTSLRRYFMDEPHNKDEQETPGIALDSFRLPCAQGDITVRLWDFAGQEITHALHQFFLTEGCIYVLVLDPRSNTEMQDAEYWLGLLMRYAGGAPVLLALNRQDAREGGYDVDRRALRERFPFIQSFTPTNCEKREGCAALVENLRTAVGLLKPTEPPHLRVPETWLQVMKDCEGEARAKPQPNSNKLLRWLGLAGHAVPSASARQHMTLEEFRKICVKRGETEPSKQESLARLLHKLGAVLHFVDEPRLRDTTVLNPHWVTDGVYRLLRFKDRPGSDGTLRLSEALQALPGETEEAARFFLRLMERFEMCFPLDEEDSGKPPSKWLIPGALGEFQPEGVTADWQKPGSVRLRYVYDPLPEGVLPRFIVMTHLLSEDKPRWRNGVVLQDGQAAALVRRGEKRNHVEVTAFGPEAERLRLLEIIQGNLERIHSDLPDPKPVAELELKELRGIFRPVADLEAAELGKLQIAVDTQQGNPPVLVEPTPQLNQASEREARGEGRVPLNAFLSYSHEDKKAKSIFQQNLTVMTKKKFIKHWHDGLIEPGKNWRVEIEENLAKMDVFVGLLTTDFLASDFIETVELKAARARLGKEDRDFLFVLIMVDDISLAELDLAEYQILKPGGKAVSQHVSRKAGFNAAQTELEQLLLHRQELKKQKKRDEPADWKHATETQDKKGITIIVQGDYVNRDKPMTHSQSIHIGGNVINSQVGQTLTNCTNMIQRQAPGERKDLLEKLAQQVRQLVAALPVDKQEEAPNVVENLEMLVKQATSTKPNRKWYSVSKEGLLEAAKYVNDFSSNIAGTLANLDKLMWPEGES
jgi:internalin A